MVCPGSINPDFVIRSDKPLKLVNKTTTFSGVSSVYAGGKGRNQAIAAKRARPDSEVCLVGCVGDDFLGAEAIRILVAGGVNADFVRKSALKETGKCILSIFKGGYQVVGLDLGANSDLTTGDVDQAEAKIAKAKILLCQIENSVETTRYSLQLAKKNGCFTILNPSLVPNDPQLVRDLYPFVDLLVLNIAEAEQLLDRKLNSQNALIAAVKEFGKRVPFVVLTRGEKGSLVFADQKFAFISAFKVKEVDTTACGDVFVGCLASALLDLTPSFKSIEEAARFASVAAGLAVTRIGASESAPTKEEILAALKEYNAAEIG